MSKRKAITELLGCPFCGHLPTVEPWHGGGPRKRMVHCLNKYCAVGPQVAGSTYGKAAKGWNYRVRSD